MQTGQEVTLSSHHGPIKRVVVRDLGEVLLVCRPDEFDSAQKERREPISVGFRKSAVIDET